MAAGVTVVVAAVVLRRLAEWLLSFLAANWFIVPILSAVGALALTVRRRARLSAERERAARLAKLRLSLSEVDGLSPTGFELAVRDLMIRDGISARHVGQRGDQAADVIGRDPLLDAVWVAQCKHTTTGSRVGSRVVYEVSGTAGPIHQADLAVVVTNGSFTRDAIKNATQLGIHLMDRDALEHWASHGTSLHEVLKIRTTPQPQPRTGRAARRQRSTRTSRNGHTAS